MINKQTIISAYDEKLTLLQWLKLVNKALDEAVLTNVEINQKGNATFVFVFTFEDGTKVESNEIIVNKGDSVNGATIRNGHLYISLTNGDELDAGNLKPVTSFAIDASQHLIVNYGDGTSQDLGAIFSGNVNVDGNFTANSIIENMSGYSYQPATKENANITYTYIGSVKNGNKVTFACSGYFSRSGDLTGGNCTLIRFTFPNSIGAKLYQTEINGISGLAFGKIDFCKSYSTHIDIPMVIMKESNSQFVITMYDLNNKAEINTSYLFRFEITFLLSDNMVK